MAKIRIGIDLMGGDYPPDSFLPMIKEIIQETSSDIEFHLFVEESFVPLISDYPEIKTTIHSCGPSIEMDDDPLLSVRRKKDSSLSMGIFAIRDKQIDAFISMGNTGALTAAYKLYIPLFEGISRPALLAKLPTKLLPIAVLDVGANIHCNEKQLIEFALLGIAYQTLQSRETPRVGLLNIGTEETKGRKELHLTYRELSKKLPMISASFAGNVEGREVFNGDIDVLVTDGFTGNIFLKTSEGISSFILQQLNDNVFLSNLASKLALSQFQKLIYFNEHPGAVLIGGEGLVMKCHGTSSYQALYHTIKDAIKLSEQNFIPSMRSLLGELKKST